MSIGKREGLAFPSILQKQAMAAKTREPQEAAAVDKETFHLEYPGSPKNQRPRQRQDHCAAPPQIHHVAAPPFIQSYAKSGPKDSG